jgi:Tol biopolymer transport system component
MKISIEGGSPSVLAEGPFFGARYSPDGKPIATYDYSVFERPKIAILNSASGAVTKTLELSSHGTLNYWDYSMLHWTPDGQALTYPLLEGTVSMNLWQQSVNGGPPRQITHFNDRILAYDWLPDGKRLAVTRSKTSSDVVLISDFH